MPAPGARGSRGRRRGGGHGGGGHEEEGGAERWLVTYADMLTLLLVLFIVLFSISVVNTSKYISLKTSLAAVFGDGTKGMLSGGVGLNDSQGTGANAQIVNNNPVAGGNPVTPLTGQSMKTGAAGQPMGKNAQPAVLPGGFTREQVAKEVNHFKGIEKRIKESLAKAGKGSSVRFKVTERGLVITLITDSLVFPGNSATLLSNGQKILASVAPPLVNEKRSIEVDGYTNQQKTDTGPYPSGWELSSARASAVVRYLIGAGVREKQLSAVGLNDLNPLYPTSDPRAVSLNRRVEIVVHTNLPSTAGPDLQAAGSE